MLCETIFAATEEIRAPFKEHDWCVSVFKDNAGVVRLTTSTAWYSRSRRTTIPRPWSLTAELHERHRRRDPRSDGDGLVAKPICNTDVFCFAPPDTPPDLLPPGVLHPRRR